MPKIKDLGIKVIPEKMRPGGGGCGCTMVSQCTEQTYVTWTPFLPCGERTANMCHVFTFCGLTHPCIGCTRFFTCGFATPHGCGPISPVCGVSIDPLGPVQFTPEQIAQLKEGLKQQIAALDQLGKSVGPRPAARKRRRKGRAKK